MKTIAPAELERIRRLSTCVVSSAIETFRVRLPNTGFADSSVKCVFPHQSPVAGYAATARIRSASPPMEGHDYYYPRSDWWKYILEIPAPRIVVIEDVDDPPGLGAFIGEVNANILLALGCVALVTNGAVRDLNEVEQTRFQMFAGNVSVSHSYAHVFDFGRPVEIGTLKIHPGDLIHGDRHGVQTIPQPIADKIPTVAQEILLRRHHLVGICRSPDFSIEKFLQEFNEPLAISEPRGGNPNLNRGERK